MSARVGVAFMARDLRDALHTVSATLRRRSMALDLRDALPERQGKGRLTVIGCLFRNQWRL
jgi:hypothetical protein